MTFTELLTVEVALEQALCFAKCDYQIRLKDFGEGDFLTETSKEEAEQYQDALDIIRKAKEEGCYDDD